MAKEKRRFRLSAKESEGDYISFTADGGDIIISGVTGRCPDADYVECVKRLVKNMIKAPEKPPYWIRHMAESVLQHLLQMAKEIGWKTSISAGAGVYIYDEDGPELTLDIAVSYGTPPKTYYSEEEYHFDDRDGRHSEGVHVVKKRLEFSNIDAEALKREVIRVAKAAYNAYSKE